jgi:tetratricopeptide (TPR) repeat protein
MDVKERLKSLLETAKLYRSQGLLFEAKGKYEDALTLIQETGLIKDGQNLIDIISKKISGVKKDIEKIAKQPTLPEVSEKDQDVIKELFSDTTGKDKDAAALEGAVTLAKFGQFDRALKDFNELLKNDSVRMTAAKNVLRCHMARTSIEDAVVQFQKWQSTDIFTKNQLTAIRLFLEVFRFDNFKENISLQLKNPAHVEKLEITDGEVPDICSMIITLVEGPLKGVTFILDVRFQIGNVITLFIEDHKEELIESFEVGNILDNLQFNSTIAIFKGKGIVAEKIRIDSGTRQGDYRIDIQVTSS